MDLVARAPANTPYNAAEPYMSDDLTSLISQLEDLQLAAERIHQQERAVTQQIRFLTERARGTRTTRPVSPTGDQHQDLTEQEFRVGQRVYIQNRIRHVPFGRRSTPRDRAAVVQRVSGDRIYITTYNGFETWRTSTNLRHLTAEEHQDIIAAQS